MTRYIIPLCLFIMVAAFSVSATVVPNLYSASIPVADQEAASQKAALQQALQTVLIKVSGQSNVLNSPAIKRAMVNSNTYVDQYSYVTNPDSIASATAPYLLNVNFEPNSVNNLLLQSKQSVWGKDRPLLLLWVLNQLVANDNTKTVDIAPELIGAKSSGVIPDSFDQFAQQRGLPIVFPLLDETDLAAVSINDLSTPVLTKVGQASTRYGANGFVIIQLFNQGSSLASIWTLSLNDNLTSWQVNATDINEIIKQGLNILTDSLASQFANSLSQKQQMLLLTVHGVDSLSKLEQLKLYLSHITAIQQLSIIKIQGSVVHLQLVVNGDSGELQNALKFGQKLVILTLPAISNSSSDGDGTSSTVMKSLDYTWSS